MGHIADIVIMAASFWEGVRGRIRADRDQITSLPCFTRLLDLQNSTFQNVLDSRVRHYSV